MNIHILVRNTTTNQKLEGRARGFAWANRLMGRGGEGEGKYAEGSVLQCRSPLNGNATRRCRREGPLFWSRVSSQPSQLVAGRQGVLPPQAAEQGCLPCHVPSSKLHAPVPQTFPSFCWPPDTLLLLCPSTVPAVSAQLFRPPAVLFDNTPNQQAQTHILVVQVSSFSGLVARSSLRPEPYAPVAPKHMPTCRSRNSTPANHAAPAANRSQKSSSRSKSSEDPKRPLAQFIVGKGVHNRPNLDRGMTSTPE